MISFLSPCFALQICYHLRTTCVRFYGFGFLTRFFLKLSQRMVLIRDTNLIGPVSLHDNKAVPEEGKSQVKSDHHVDE